MHTYSQIWLRIIDIRAKLGGVGNKLDSETYKRVKDLGIVKKRKRGTNGGVKRKYKARQTGVKCKLCHGVRDCNKNNVIIVENFIDFGFCKCEAGEFVNTIFTREIENDIDKVRNKRAHNISNLVKIPCNSLLFSRFVFGLVNLQSICNKVGQFQQCVIDGKFDVLCLVETWLSECDDVTRT